MRFLRSGGIFTGKLSLQNGLCSTALALHQEFSPPVDVVELPDQIIILVEIAGMQAQDFNISLVNQTLVISGVRHRPPFENQGAYHRVEIGFGEFRLDLPLPWSVQKDVVSATYRDGFLKIDLPRQAEKQIQIAETTEQDDVADAE